jgi:hypothetical protein
MELRSGTIEFPVGTGERSQTLTFLFPREVIESHVALTGYEAKYADGDHHIKRLTVKLFSKIGARIDEGFEVVVTAVFNLRDEDGNDPYSGVISFVLFAQFQSLIPPIIFK